MSKSAWFGLDKGPTVGFERPQDGVRFGSPSIDWLFGSYGFLPFGYSAVAYGKPRSGKSVIAWSAVAELHKRDPEAKVIWIDTEMRVGLQQGGATSKGIDMDRVLIQQSNDPVFIFDWLCKDVPAAIQSGLKVPLVVIDSLSMIRGRRSMNAESLETQQIGDRALTLQEGFSRLIPVIRKYKIALLCTAQARAELDTQQIMMRKTWKMDSSYGVKHLIEFFLSVEQVESKAGKLYDESKTDGRDEALLTGNKIRLCMTESSAGGKSRAAEVTLSYEDGFINKGEEVATLGKNLGVITQTEGSRACVFGDNKYSNFAALCQALETNELLRDDVVKAIMSKTKGQE